jgi:glyoxylase-like metal-dependent hydrolase (beta-lactamase superfamily II)
MNTIDVPTLRTWLAAGEPVTVLDVRTDMDYAEWFIPNSIHVNAYDALKANDPNALASVNVPQETPIVTVCGAGKVSVRAAEQLAERGYEVYSLEGGMKAWSLAWNSAEVPTAANARVVQVRRTGKGCLSYLVGADGVAAVIDASLPPEVYRHLAAEYGWQITQVIETHVHADHLSRARQLVEQTGATLLLPDNNRVSFPFTPIRDGETLPIGMARLRAIHTPGHTWESTSYVLDEAAVFTGDTLFLSSIGRPDLHASAEEGRTKAHALYQSLQQLVQLAPTLVVLPAHTSTPIVFDPTPLSAPLRVVIAQTPLLHEAEELFVATLLTRVGATPANFLQIVALNEHGELPAGDPTDLESGANRCAVA